MPVSGACRFRFQQVFVGAVSRPGGRVDFAPVRRFWRRRFGWCPRASSCFGFVQIVGVLLITSLLIIPPAIARVFSNSPVVMIFTSMLVSIAAVLLGLYLSIDYDLATGPTIVITLGALFFIAQFLPKKT